MANDIQFPDGTWGSQEELDAMNAGNNLGPNASQSEHAAAEQKLRDTSGAGWDAAQHGDARTAYNPGSADVGGGPGMGEEYRQAAFDGMRSGDPAMAANDAAMSGSIANMSGDRGIMSPENASLLAREASSRKQQIGALDMQRVAAQGGAPSAAAFQTTGAMDASMAGQSGAGGAARGLSALNGVQGIGASNVGASGGNIAMHGGMDRSKEIADATGMYGSNAGTMRQGDLQRQREGDSNSLANAGMNNDWKLGNAGLAGKQGALGVDQEKTRGAWYDASTEPAQHQAAYDQAMQGMQHGQNSGQASADRARNIEREQHAREMYGTAISGGLTMLGGGAQGIGGSIVNHKYG